MLQPDSGGAKKRRRRRKPNAKAHGGQAAE